MDSALTIDVIYGEKTGMTYQNSICVYCGSSPGSDPAFMASAQVLGTAMAAANIRLVYGGGTRGIMGAVADAVIAGGGHVLGVIPDFLVQKEAPDEGHNPNRETIVVDSMHVRKQMMFEQSDAFVTLPGGIGTIEEIVEILTWAQLGKHTKPMVFANVNNYWAPMIEMIDHIKQAGFLHNADKMVPLVIDQPTDIVPRITAAWQA